MPTAETEAYRQPYLDWILPPGKVHYSLREAARYLGISRDSVQRLVDAGEILALKHDKMRGDGSRGLTIILREGLLQYMSTQLTLDQVARRGCMCEALTTFPVEDLIFLRAEITRIIEQRQRHNRR